MSKKILPIALSLAVILVSVIIVILPSFFSKSISYIELNQELKLEKVLNGSEDIELVFFGYAGCLNICTPRIHDIALWYKTLSKDEQKHVTLKFFDLSMPEDSQVPDIFVKTFHPNFKGVYLSNKVIRDYTKAFTVYFSKSLFNEGEIDHSTHLYITKHSQNKKILRGIYTSYPYDFKLINAKLQGLLSE